MFNEKLADPFSNKVNSLHNKSEFMSGLHPLTSLIYFMAVLSVVMFIFHPVFLLISTISGIIYYIILKHKNFTNTSLLFLIPIFIFITLFNPLFNHNGNTVLFSIFNTPITLEALIYGLFSAFLFVASIIWFSCFSVIFDSEKIIFVFGKSLPTLSMLLCMIFRLIPKFKRRLTDIMQTKKAAHTKHSNKKDKLSYMLENFSLMSALSLESSLTTTDSMCSRGFGLKKRSCFSIYKYNSKDIVYTILSVSLLLFTFICFYTLDLKSSYFPNFEIPSLTTYSVIPYISYFLLAFLPILFQLLEDLKWHFWKSKI